MPGTVASMPKIGVPVTIAAVSTLVVRLPMMRKSLGSFSTTVVRLGVGRAAALVASSP